MTRKTKTGSQARQTAHPKSAVEATITAARNGSARRSKGIHALLALSRRLPLVHALTSAAISSTRRLALTQRTEGLFLRIFSTGTPQRQLPSNLMQCIFNILRCIRCWCWSSRVIAARGSEYEFTHDKVPQDGSIVCAEFYSRARALIDRGS